MLTNYVYGDWDTTVVYRAESFAPEWNGFAVPVVTRQTLRAMIADSAGYSVTFDAAGIATVAYSSVGTSWEGIGDSDPNPEYAVITPDANEHYACDFGWTFYRADDSDTDYIRASVIDAMRVAMQGESILAMESLMSRLPSFAIDARVTHWVRADGRPACGVANNVLTEGDAGLATCEACRTVFASEYGSEPTMG